MAIKGDVSDLDTLMYGGEPIVPQVAIGGYSYRLKSGVVMNDTTGGATRQRTKFFGMPYRANASFYAETALMQDYILSFMRRNQGKKFICHTRADRPIVEPYVVQVIDDWEFQDVNFKDCVLTVELEIVSVRDDCLDEFIYNTYSCWGDNAYCNLKAFGEIVNKVPTA